MNLHDKVTIPAQVLDNQIDEEIVILDLASGTYFGLNPVGAAIWSALREGKTLAETCQVIVDQYDVSPSDVARDVIHLTTELLAKKLVHLQQPAIA
ncbi:MAG: PqqD family protein [Caldilineaceae bacterium]|nr:PqqD family protein [Caldilineaceae bacterium]